MTRAFLLTLILSLMPGSALANEMTRVIILTGTTNEPDYGGCGGRFGPDKITDVQAFTRKVVPGEASYHDYRMYAGAIDSWTVTPTRSGANHNPLTAQGSSRPGGDTLFCCWSHCPQPGGPKNAITVKYRDTPTAILIVPPETAGQPIHIILEVRDGGAPNLYSYRRIIAGVKEQPCPASLTSPNNTKISTVPPPANPPSSTYQS